MLKTRLMQWVKKLKVMMTMKSTMMMKWKPELTLYTILVYPWRRRSLLIFKLSELRYIKKLDRTRTSKQPMKL